MQISETLNNAITAVLEAEDNFRSGMPHNWEGDPLTDAVAELRTALSQAEPTPENKHVSDNMLKETAFSNMAVDAERHERAIEAAFQAIPTHYFMKDGERFYQCNIRSDDVETIIRAYLSAMSAGTVAQEPWGWVVPRGGKKKPVILDSANHDEISAICEAEIHELGYFPVYANPQPAANPEVAVKALEWEYVERPAMTYTAYWQDGDVSYYIDQTFGSDSFYFRTVRWPEETIYDGDDLPSAQAAAQADYEQRIRSALSAMSAGTVAQEAVKSVRIPYEKRPIAIKRSVDVESFYAASEQEQAAWNKYAQDEADKFNSNPSLDTYDSTNTYDWCPPRSFPEWIKEYRFAIASPQASEPAPQGVGDMVKALEFYANLEIYKPHPPVPVDDEEDLHEELIRELIGALKEIDIGFVAPKDAPEAHDEAVKCARAALSRAEAIIGGKK